MNNRHYHNPVRVSCGAGCLSELPNVVGGAGGAAGNISGGIGFGLAPPVGRSHLKETWKYRNTSGK
jgi:hypothetical protein